MATHESKSKKKLVAKMILFGIISISEYVAVFTHQDIVTKYATIGSAA